MKRLITITLTVFAINITLAQCYQPNVDKGNASLAKGNYAEAYDYFTKATKCPDASRFNNGQEAKDNMKKCLPVLTIEGKTVFEINVGPEAGEHTFNVQSERIRMWLIDGGHRRQGINVSTNTMGDTFRASWDANPTNAPRDLTIRLYGVDGVKDIDAKVIIHQAAGGLRVNGERELEKSFSWEGGVARFDVTGIPQGEQYQITGVDTTWMSVQKNDNHFFVIVKTLEKGGLRTSTIKVFVGGESVDMVIKQETGEYSDCIKDRGRLNVPDVFSPIEGGLIPIRLYVEKENDCFRYGLINKKGDIIIPPIFDKLSLVWLSEEKMLYLPTDDHKSYCLFNENGVYNTITGTVGIPFRFSDGSIVIINNSSNTISFFSSDGTFVNRITDFDFNNLCKNGVIAGIKHGVPIVLTVKNGYTTQMKIPKEIEVVTSISDEGLVFGTASNDKFGAFNLKGNWVIKPIYDGLHYTRHSPFLVHKGKEIMYINENGAIIYNLGRNITKVKPFNNGVYYAKRNDGRLYATSNKGEMLFSLDTFRLCFDAFFSAKDWSPWGMDYGEGMLRLELKGSSFSWYTYVDPHGEIRECYREAREYSHGLAAVVALFDEWQLINKAGECVYKPPLKSNMKNDYCDYLGEYNGLKIFGNVKYSKEWTPRDYYLVDSLGHVFDGDVSKIVKIMDWNNGRAIISINNVCGVISDNGQIIVLPFYDRINDFVEGVASVRLGTKWGFVSENGRVIIPTVFDAVESFHNGYATVTIDGEKYRINKNGTILTY